MLCKTVAELPGGNEWIYEVKWGGQRAIVVKDGAQVRVFAENGNRLAYPEIEKTVGDVAPESAVIDGEIIGLTRDGKRCEPSPDCHLKLHAFDLIHINGRDLNAAKANCAPRQSIRSCCFALRWNASPVYSLKRCVSCHSRVW